MSLYFTLATNTCFASSGLTIDYLECPLLNIANLYVWYPSGSQYASSTMISTVVERTLHLHPRLAPPLSTYHITLLYTELSFLSNARHKTPPQARRICRGVKPGVVFGSLRRAMLSPIRNGRPTRLAAWSCRSPPGRRSASACASHPHSRSIKPGRATKLALSLVLSEVEGPVEGSARARGM